MTPEPIEQEVREEPVKNAPQSLIANLLLAGRIVGLDPREMVANALDELRREQEEAGG